MGSDAMESSSTLETSDGLNFLTEFASSSPFTLAPVAGMLGIFKPRVIFFPQIADGLSLIVLEVLSMMLALEAPGLLIASLFIVLLFVLLAICECVFVGVMSRM
jgi:hypothetical protein